MRTLIVSLVIFHSAQLFAGPCGQELFERTHQLETIGDVQVRVEKLSTGRSAKEKSHPGLPLEAVFGAEPQVLLGVDRSNGSEPYLIVGNTVVRIVSHRTETSTIWVYNAALKMSMPQQQTTTIYQLGSRPATVVHSGYFIRLTGIPAAQVRAIEQSLDLQAFPRENPSWQGTIENLLIGLNQNFGIHLACAKPNCSTLSGLLSRSSESGFVSVSGRIGAEFVLVDEPSLEGIFKRARLRTVATNVAYGAMFTTLGAIGAGLGYLIGVIALGWPMPF